jgi:hypothetical protein
VHNVFTVTLGNIGEQKRFSQTSWRLAAFLPANLLNDEGNKLSTFKMTEIVQKACKLVFTNYNTLLKSGQMVKCSDGVIRDMVYVLNQWMGDQPEISKILGLVQVRNAPNKQQMFCFYTKFLFAMHRT